MEYGAGPQMLKIIAPGVAPELTFWMAWRKEPAPLSFVVVTVYVVAEKAASGASPTKKAASAAIWPVARVPCFSFQFPVKRLAKKANTRPTSPFSFLKLDTFGAHGF